MYSGTTLRDSSGNLLGAHQKIDRVAWRCLNQVLPDRPFPSIKQILHFEGLNGPDGIKRKSPGTDEPWHFIDAKNPDDAPLLDMIDNHTQNLTTALKNNNTVRAAFEAAWLAHAITDGLTPAHHYPYEEKLEQLRDGKDKTSRNSIKTKIIMPGKTRRMKIKNNWEFWGAKGVMTTHVLFEMGVSTAIVSRRMKIAEPTKNELTQIGRTGVRAYFLATLRSIDQMNLYALFQKQGWTEALARQAYEELVPAIIRTVTLSWYYAAMQANDDTKS